MSTSQYSSSDYRHRDRIAIERALISVSDKTGLVELATSLHAANVAIVSTGSTAAAINSFPIFILVANPTIEPAGTFIFD